MIKLAKAFIFSAILAVLFASPLATAAPVKLYDNTTANFPGQGSDHVAVTGPLYDSFSTARQASTWSICSSAYRTVVSTPGPSPSICMPIARPDRALFWQRSELSTTTFSVPPPASICWGCRRRQP
jgi:hypothetical protein